METAVNTEGLNKIKLEEVEKIKANPEYKQMHVDRIMRGQPQGLSPRIYTPIKSLKDRLRT